MSLKLKVQNVNLRIYAGVREDKDKDVTGANVCSGVTQNTESGEIVHLFINF